MRTLWCTAALATTALATSFGSADEKMVTAPGSRVEFPTNVVEMVNEQQVSLRMTGVGMRQKVVFNVYAIASYMDEKCKAKSAAELATADVCKKLHLVLERDVAGKDMAENLRAGVRANHPQDFEEELKMLDDFVSKLELKKGTHVTMLNQPGKGLFAMVGDKQAVEISNPKFATAVWEIYLGKKNLGDKLKRGLTAKL